MQSYSSFIFDSYSWNPSEHSVQLHYSLDGDIEFVETLKFPSLPPEFPTDAQKRALVSLLLIGGISYYKTCLPKTLQLGSSTLTEDQAHFWNDVYENGLGEFFFKNDIDFQGLIHFPHGTAGAPRLGHERSAPKKPKILVPVGGGKDSVVTVELLRAAGYDITLLRMGSHPFIEKLAHAMNLPLITIERHLSPALFKLNADGALNGHVPITAYLSCVTILTALLYNFDAVAMSNERSASEGNIEFHGKEINHQWSKSLSFEQSFQEYVKRFITWDVDYFSPLRPLSELHIAKIFSQYPQYFPLTTSCNTNWRILKKKEIGGGAMNRSPQATGSWCGKCPKCAFVFAIMSAFLPAPTVIEMFGGKNLYADDTLLPLYKELLGSEGFKPFECVGTPEETKAAFLLAHERGDLDDTPIMKMFLKDILKTIKKPKELIQKCLTPSEDHAIPPQFQSILSNAH